MILVAYPTHTAFNALWNPNAKNCYQEWTVQYWVLIHKALFVWEDDPANDKGTSGLPTYRPVFDIACLTYWGRNEIDVILQTTFSNAFSWMKNVLLAIKISLEFIPNGSIKSISALGQIMAWRRPGHKPLSEPMLRSLLTHTCVTRPHWVNGCNEICTLCNMVWVNLNIQELQKIHYYVYWCTGAFWCQDIYNHHNGIAWAVRFTHNGSLLHGPLA